MDRKMDKKNQVQPAPKKEELIERLLKKAALDFRCCGHGPKKAGN